MAIQYKALVHVAIRANCYETMYDFYVNKLGGREIFHLNHDSRPIGKGNENIWLTYICFGKNQYVEMFTDKYVDSVYMRSSQNSQPNSDTSDVNSGKERGRVFRIARGDPSPAF